MRLEYEISQTEFLDMAWYRHRSSIRWLIGILIGLAGLCMGISFYFYVDHALGWLLVVLCALLLSMQLIIPGLAFRRVYRRNPRMFGPRSVTVSAEGIISDHQLGHAETKWNNYDKYHETTRSFLLHQSADVIGILPKRAFASQADLEQFRALINSKIRRV